MNTLLVGSDIKLDASLWRGQGEQNQVCSLRSRVARAIHNEGIVIACAVKAATVKSFQDVLANLFGGGEVVRCVGGSQKLPGGNFNIVNTNVTCGVGHVQSVVQNRGSFLVDKGAEIPINVVGEHDGSRLVERNGDQSRGPSRPSWVR